MATHDLLGWQLTSVLHALLAAKSGWLGLQPKPGEGTHPALLHDYRPVPCAATFASSNSLLSPLFRLQRWACWS